MHDFERGIDDSGLFWTVAVSHGSVDVHEDDGKARFRADTMKIDDYHDFGNAVSPDPETVPSKVSFDVRWQGGGDETPISRCALL